MRAGGSSLGFFGALALLALACGDTPQVYRHVPRVETKKVAIGAAAAATALTLADAQRQGRPTKEKKTAPDKRPVKSGGSVPASVLDRLDEKPADQDCSEDAAPAKPKNTVELIPTEDESESGVAPPKRKKCKDPDDPGDDDDPKAPESE
jgi:hypothetical protein